MEPLSHHRGQNCNLYRLERISLVNRGCARLGPDIERTAGT